VQKDHWWHRRYKDGLVYSAFNPERFLRTLIVCADVVLASLRQDHKHVVCCFVFHPLPKEIWDSFCASSGVLLTYKGVRAYEALVKLRNMAAHRYKTLFRHGCETVVATRHCDRKKACGKTRRRPFRPVSIHTVLGTEHIAKSLSANTVLKMAPEFFKVDTAACLRRMQPFYQPYIKDSLFLHHKKIVAMPTGTLYAYIMSSWGGSNHRA